MTDKASSSSAKAPPHQPKQFFLGVAESALKQQREFVGYKLKEENTLTSARVRLSLMVYNHPPNMKQTSVQHLRLLSETNMLVVDPYTLRSNIQTKLFLILDDGNLHLVKFDSGDFSISDFAKVMTLYPPRRDRSLPPSVQFVSMTCAVVCDGGRVLTFYETDTAREKWDPFFEYRVIGPQAPGTKPGCDRPPPDADFGFYIVDARLTMGKQTIDVCLRAVQDYDDDRLSENLIRWITVEIADPKEHKWTLKRAKSVLIPGDIEMVGFDRSCEHLVVISSKPPKVIDDEHVDRKEDDPLSAYKQEQEENRAKFKIVYGWTEQGRDVTAMVRLEQEDAFALKDEDIEFDSSMVNLKIRAKKTVIFNGLLGGPIDEGNFELLPPTEGCRHLKLEMRKANDDEWPYFIKNDERGKYEEDVEGIDMLMKSLESQEFVDKELPLVYWTTGEGTGTVTDGIEECDVDGTEKAMYYLHEKSNNIEHYCDLTGKQILFNARAFPPLSFTRAVCIREGNDGHVFNFEVFPPRYGQLLKAFGHVSTGKPLRRYASVSPHGGYALIVDQNTNAYVYWQTNGELGDLIRYCDVRKRAHTKADNKCPMQVLTMRADKDDEDVDNEIIGFATMEDTVALLSCDTLVFHRLRKVERSHSPPVDRSVYEAIMTQRQPKPIPYITVTRPKDDK